MLMNRKHVNRKKSTIYFLEIEKRGMDKQKWLIRIKRIMMKGYKRINENSVTKMKDRKWSNGNEGIKTDKWK